MLSKATESMLLDALLKKVDNETQEPLFMAKAIPLANGQMQLLAIIPNKVMLSIVQQDKTEEE